MKFRTEYKATPIEPSLDPSRPIVLVGSCFASNIALKMQSCQWAAFNGIGTLYNPVSIAKVLSWMIFNDGASDALENSLLVCENRVHSWLFDSHFSASSKERCKERIYDAREGLLSALENAQALIVTFGTAWCYSIGNPDVNENERYIVANCHKMPSALFRRERLNPDEISSLWIDLCHRLKEKYPQLRIIFTVSPVRHLKDGFEGNSLSKAILLLAIEKICKNIDFCIYFPAYEIVCDDLRDYRFYASDMVHPSQTAVEYIWEIFLKTFIDENGEKMLKEGEKRFKAMSHRPIFNE